MEHNTGEDSCKHDTATDEASHRIQLTIHTLHKELDTTRFYHLRKRAYISGMIMAFTMVVDVLASLARKYDNNRGEFN